jgi:flagellar biosynthesis chaperone FliJ
VATPKKKVNEMDEEQISYDGILSKLPMLTTDQLNSIGDRKLRNRAILNHAKRRGVSVKQVCSEMMQQHLQELRSKVQELRPKIVAKRQELLDTQDLLDDAVSMGINMGNIGSIISATIERLDAILAASLEHSTP